MQKRENYISWDEYFMGLAKMSSLRSKDPKTQVGSCIVNSQNKIISLGYNGFPVGVSDDDFPWGKEGELSETKHAYVCHAEANAILNCIASSLEGGTIYVTLFPCHECAKLIIQARISKIIYCNIKEEKQETIAAKKMFDYVGIKYEQYHNNGKNIEIEL